jgi:hypothetical protein
MGPSRARRRAGRGGIVSAMRTRRVRPSTLLGTVAVVILVAACGGGDDGGGEQAKPPTTDESQAEGPCALLTAEEVSDLFGTQAEVAPPAGDGQSANSCLWEATTEDDDLPTRYQLQLSVYQGDAQLDPRSYGEESEPVDGLGDEGFVVANGTLGTTAGYRDGDRTVIMTYAIVGGEDAPTSSESADDVVDLLRAADERSSESETGSESGG